MFSFHLNNNSSRQLASEGVEFTPRRKRPFSLLQVIGLPRQMRPEQLQEEVAQEEQSQPVKAQRNRSRAKQVQERRNVPDRRKAVRPMLPDRQNAGERRRKDRRRTADGV
jgi:hypothetical protein